MRSQKNHPDYKLYSKVLYIGPKVTDSKTLGYLIGCFDKYLPCFRFHPTVIRGKKNFFDYLRFSTTFIALPYYRYVKGKKIAHIIGSDGRNWKAKSNILKYAKLLGYKTIYHSLGGTYCEFTQDSPKSRADEYFNFCDALLIPSYIRKAWFDENFHPKNSMVLRTMVDPLETDDILQPSPIPIILFNGDFSVEKGVFDIVDCLKTYHLQLGGKVKVVLVGSGKGAELRQAVAENHLEDVIDIFGWLDRSNKAFVTNSSDIFLSMSYSELMPINIIEAMLQGLPVIGTPVGATTELIKDSENGFIIPVGDRDALYETIMKYVNNPSLIRIHGEAAAKAVADFRPDAVIARLSDIYRDLLAEDADK